MSKITPIIKWAGGKTQLLSKLFEYIPTNKKVITIQNYYEPFAGGLSVFLELLNLCERGKAVIKNFYISDINACLIALYQAIKVNVKDLIEELDIIIKNYNKFDNLKSVNNKFNILEEADSKEFVYYYYRKLYNDYNSNSIKKVAVFLFLNKTGFRGLFRENSKGGFNVPFW